MRRHPAFWILVFLAVVLYIVAVASAQPIRPRAPKPAPVVVLPPCDFNVLIDLLDEWFEPAPTDYVDPELYAPRTYELNRLAVKYTKDFQLSRDIDAMRRACSSYVPPRGFRR